MQLTQTQAVRQVLTVKCKHAPVSGGTIKNSSYAKPCLLPWDDCKHQDEDGVLRTLEQRPFIDMCKCKAMGLLQSGIMAGSHCGSSDHGSLDHCVQLVGYNRSDKSAPYWIVRNSWDTTWGQDGLYTLPWEITLAVWQMSRRLLLYKVRVGLKGTTQIKIQILYQSYDPLIIKRKNLKNRRRRRSREVRVIHHYLNYYIVNILLLKLLLRHYYFFIILFYFFYYYYYYYYYLLLHNKQQ